MFSILAIFLLASRILAQDYEYFVDPLGLLPDQNSSVFASLSSAFGQINSLSGNFSVTLILYSTTAQPLNVQTEIDITQNVSVYSYFQDSALVAMSNQGRFVLAEGLNLNLSNVIFTLNYQPGNSPNTTIFKLSGFSQLIIETSSFNLLETSGLSAIFVFDGSTYVSIDSLKLNGSLNCRYIFFANGELEFFHLKNSVISDIQGGQSLDSLFDITSKWIYFTANCFKNITITALNKRFFQIVGMEVCNFTGGSFDSISGNYSYLIYASCQKAYFSDNVFTSINTYVSLLTLPECYYITIDSIIFLNSLALGLDISEFSSLNLSNLTASWISFPVVNLLQTKDQLLNPIPVSLAGLHIENIENVLLSNCLGVLAVSMASLTNLSITNSEFLLTYPNGLESRYMIYISVPDSESMAKNLTIANNSNLAGVLWVSALSFALNDSQFLNNTNLKLSLMGLRVHNLINFGLKITDNIAYAAGIDVQTMGKDFQGFSAQYIHCERNRVELFGGCYHFNTIYAANYTVSDSLMRNCSSNYVSGAVDIFNTLTTSITCYYEFRNVSFINNTASFQGGAGSFFYHDRSYVVLIFNCTFAGNIASKGGALILNMDSSANTIKISQSSFFSNEAESGAAFSLIAGVLEFDQAEFNGNKGTRGGAIESMGSSTLVFVDSNLINNVATRYGGVFLLLDRSVANVSSTRISGFQANFGGIAYLDTNSVIRLSDCEILNGSGVSGGLIYMSNGELTLSNLTFSNITAIVSLMFLDHSDISVSKVSITSSNSTIFDLNSAFFTVTDLNLDTISCMFHNQEGCIFSVKENSELNIDNFTVKNVYSEYKGGVFFLIDSTELTLTASTFNNITNLRTGALFYCEYCSISMENSIIYNLRYDLIYGFHASFSLEGLSFQNPAFTNNLSYINIDSSPYFLMKNCNFSGLISSHHGGLFYLSNEEMLDIETLIINCRFMNISGQQNGGVIYVENSALTIASSQFINNSANNGGCIYFQCDEGDYWDYCNLNLSGNSFLSNQAKIHGGVIKWRSKKPVGFSTNTFTGNTAVFYGNDRASFPIKLAVQLYNTSNASQIYFSLEKSLNQTLYGPQAQSGQKVDFSMDFFLIDDEDQIIKNIGNAKLYIDIVTYELEIETMRRRFGIPQEDESTLVNYTSNLSDIAGQTSQNMNTTTSIFSFDDLTLTARPSTTIFLKVTSLEIKQFQSQLFPANNSYPLNHFNYRGHYVYYIPMVIGACIPGEIYDNQSNTCYKCPKGTYSYYIFDETCKNCLDHAQCPGTNGLELDEGYWRSSPISENIYRCSAILYLCNGGVNSTCEEGYTGRLCEVCEDINGNKANKNYFGLCQECANVGVNILISIPMGIGVLIILKLLANYIAKLDKKNTLEIALIKLLILHYQMLTLIPNVNTSFGQTPNQILGGLTRNWFSYDCVFGMVFGFASELNNRMLSITILLFLFSAAANFALIRWKQEYYDLILGYLIKIRDQVLRNGRERGTKIYVQAKSNPSTPAISVVKDGAFRTPDQTSHDEKLHNIIIYNSVWLYLIQTSMLDLSFLGMRCVDIDGVSYNRYSLNYECWSKDHLLWIIILYVPNILIWMFGLTWLMYRWLIKVKKINKKSIIIASAGFKRRFYFWGDFMNLVRKSIVIIINTFSNENSETIPFTIFLLCSFLLLMHFYSRPYSYKILNYLDFFSLYIVFSTYYTLSYYYTSIDIALADFFYGLLITMHIIWVGLWVVVFFRKFIQKLLLKALKLDSAQIHPATKSNK